MLHPVREKHMQEWLYYESVIKNIMMNKVLIKCNMNGNARGKPDLKLRDGPALKKTRGAPGWILKDAAFYSGSGLKNLYRKENLLHGCQVVGTHIRKPGFNCGSEFCLLLKPGNGSVIRGEWKVVKDLYFN